MSNRIHILRDCLCSVFVCTILLAGCPSDGTQQDNPQTTNPPADNTGGDDTTGLDGNGDDATGLDGNGDAATTDPGIEGPPATHAIDSIYGDYAVTFTGRVGGPYEPSGSLVSGTTTGIRSFVASGTVTLSESQAGVIAVPDGRSLPGVAAEDIIFGAAYMRNPIRVFIGTTTVDLAGDFGFHTMLTFGIPADPVDIFPESAGRGGCETPADQPFACSPTFFQSTTPSGNNVNLIYFVTSVESDGQSFTVSGELIDRHVAEAAAANLFTVPIESPILGTMNDQFTFADGATFELTISGDAISGSVTGQGSSAAGLVPQLAVLEATISGTREP